MFLRVKLLPLLLENLLAVLLMLGNAVRVELSPASHPALNELRRVILNDIYLVLSVHLLDASLLLGVVVFLVLLLPGRLSGLLTRGLSRLLTRGLSRLLAGRLPDFAWLLTRSPSDIRASRLGVTVGVLIIVGLLRLFLIP